MIFISLSENFVCGAYYQKRARIFLLYYVLQFGIKLLFYHAEEHFLLFARERARSLEVGRADVEFL